VNPETIVKAKNSCAKEQSQLLYKLDGRGHRVINEETGLPVTDLARAPRLLGSVGVPPGMTSATFDASTFAQADDVRQWFDVVVEAASPRYLALFFGPGNNHTAAAVARSAVEHLMTIAWYNWHDFVSRYTDGIDRSRVLAGGLSEDAAVAAQESEDARDEDFKLRYVYDALVITDVDLDDVRDFAVPDIISMFRVRSDYMLTTILTVSSANSPDFERKAELLGKRGALLRLFEDEGARFDGR
jgi:hypothetical protein